MPRPCLPLRVRGIGRFRLTRPSDDVRSARVSTRPGPGASRTTRGVVNPAWETFAAFGLRQPVLASCATRGRVLATRQRAPELPWRGGRSSGYARPRSRGLPRFHHRASRPFRQSFRQAPWGIALRNIPSLGPRGRSLQNEAISENVSASDQFEPRSRPVPLQLVERMEYDRKPGSVGASRKDVFRCAELRCAFGERQGRSTRRGSRPVRGDESLAATRALPKLAERARAEDGARGARPCPRKSPSRLF